jgi:hypothetical protein
MMLFSELLSVAERRHVGLDLWGDDVNTCCSRSFFSAVLAVFGHPARGMSITVPVASNYLFKRAMVFGFGSSSPYS